MTEQLPEQADLTTCVTPPPAECPSRCGWNEPCSNPWHDRRDLPPADPTPPTEDRA